MYLKKWPQVKNGVLFLRSVGVKKSNHLIRIIDDFEQGQIFCRNGIAHHLMQLLNQRLQYLRHAAPWDAFLFSQFVSG